MIRLEHEPDINVSLDELRHGASQERLAEQGKNGNNTEDHGLVTYGYPS